MPDPLNLQTRQRRLWALPIALITTAAQRRKELYTILGKTEAMQQNTSRHGPFFVFLISTKANGEKRQWRHSFFSFRMQ